MCIRDRLVISYTLKLSGFQLSTFRQERWYFLQEARKWVDENGEFSFWTYNPTTTMITVWQSRFRVWQYHVIERMFSYGTYFPIETKLPTSISGENRPLKFLLTQTTSKSKFFIYCGSALSSEASSPALHFERNLTGWESQLVGGKPVGYNLYKRNREVSQLGRTTWNKSS